MISHINIYFDTYCKFCLFEVNSYNQLYKKIKKKIKRRCKINNNRNSLITLNLVIIDYTIMRFHIIGLLIESHTSAYRTVICFNICSEPYC